MQFTNIPQVRLGVVATSRDCFPRTLSERRRAALIEACHTAGLSVYESKVTVENENDAKRALDDVNAAGVNALVVYLGNFGPEGPETQLAQKFGGPVMFAAAAEETKDDLFDGRGDAFCGMLNASYNLGLRGVNAYISEYPVGTAAGVARMIAEFVPVARVYIGVHNLKIMTFGPRPYDFLACNAPIAPLYRLGVEVQENSELDLYQSFLQHEGDARIAAVAADMERELAGHNNYPSVTQSLAQYELTLTDWIEKNKGESGFVAYANKCWPAFQTMFHFVPCFVNSRLASKGIPVACEVDIYGALSEYILACVTGDAVTLLDINNTVPQDTFDQYRAQIGSYKQTDLFMGFHCGNTPSCKLKSCKLDFQRIMRRGLEPDKEPYFSRGTLEGDLAASPITFFRLQGSADSELVSYIAQGDILDVPTKSFGGIGVMAIPEMGRFYRHVLIEKRFPHHGGVGFEHCAKSVYSALRLLGVCPERIYHNQPAGVLYKTENPWE